MLSRLMSSWMRNGAILAVVMSSVLDSRAIALRPSEGIALQTPSAELPIVRSSILQPNLRVPWSQPVRVIDAFEGESLAVFDQNYFSRSFRNSNGQVKVVSLWKPNAVRVLLAYSGRECTIGTRRNFGAIAHRSFHRRLYASRFGYYPFGYFDDGFPNSVCIVNNGTEKITGLSVKVGERVFQLDNKNGQFPITSELATVLKSAPEQNVHLRATADNGEVVDSVIGQATVRAWKRIY
ncbi:hypothetical protein [Myxacorys almedinensis]|uniref:Uncharacterized protein n=1 Tax=Myxacorys almedinensis A TaxID=2690445 RepID=A0A8J8CGM8_9CYAN|nr:hypothetical protein [Myxacorys almedinensis]NDJ15754.1 hypothetical protein [Myxacorys almedinensis A]